MFALGNARARSIGVGELGMEHPGVQRQAERGQPGQARAEVGPLHVVRARGHGAVADDRRSASHAAEWRTPRNRPPPARSCASQHRLHAIAEREVGEADDAGRDARSAVAAAVAHRGDAGHELRLAHRPHLRRAAGAVHRVALEEHGGDDVVAGAEVGEQLVEQVAMVGPLPQVMVGVDDRQLGLEDRLGRRLGQPRLGRRADAPVAGRPRVLAHVSACGGRCRGRGSGRSARSRWTAAPAWPPAAGSCSSRAR